MGAVRLLAGSDIRRRGRSAVALALLVGVIGTIVLATAAGARRSETALPRFTVFSRSADASFLPGGLGYTPTPAQLRAVRHLPGVAAVGEVRFFAVQGKGLPSSDSIAAAVDGTEGNEVERARVIAGRAANPNAADELDIDEPRAVQSHLHVGSVVSLESATPAQFRAAVATGRPPGRPEGPRVQLHVVGIVRRPLDLGDGATAGGIILLTPAFNRTYMNRIGNFGVALDVRTVRGAADVPSVTAGVRKIFQADGGASPQDATATTSGASDAINVLTLALWILAAVVALAGTVAVAIVLSREVARIGVDQATLRSLGLTRTQRVLTSLPRALLVAGGGGLLAVLGAVLISPLFPLGIARQADPNVGFHVDWVVIGPGLVAVAVIVIAIALVAAARNTGRAALASDTGTRRRASSIVDGAARVAAPPTVTNGLRMALEPGRGRTAVPVRSAYFGMVFGVIGVTAVLVFAASLGQLGATPTRYGWTWDFKAEQTNFNPDANHGCDTNDDFGMTGVEGVGAIAAVCADGVQVGGRPVIGWSYAPVRGSISPGIVAGRAPRADDEVALGTLTLNALHEHIGDSVSGRGPHGSAQYLIVGRAVFPRLDDPQPLAAGAVFTNGGLTRIFDSNAAASRFIVGRYAPGRDAMVVDRRIAALPGLDAPAGPTVPVEIARIRQINWLPATLAVILGCLALLAVGHALVTAVRRRGRELALLKTLGFTRRQVHATVAWQATTLAVVGLVVGIPVGIVVGKVLWRAVTDGLGVATGTVIPAAVLAAGAIGALVLVNLTALLPARSAGRTKPGVSLRSE